MSDRKISINMGIQELEEKGFCDQITAQGIEVKTPYYLKVYDVFAKCISLLNNADILTFDEASKATQILLHKVETETLAKKEGEK